MKRFLGAWVALALASSLALGACNTDAPGGNGTPDASPTVGVTSAAATLEHTPRGTTDLTWNPSDKTLQVKIAMTGFAPNTTHAAHIHTGSCANPGAPVYGLPNLHADAHGNITYTYTVQNVANGIPANGRYFNVHNGTEGDTYSKMDIACADIANPTTAANGTQTVHLVLTGGMAPSQNASGTAQLRVENGNLLVSVTMNGLEPGSTHPAHIHTGSCESQGPEKYMIPDLKADGAGHATATVIHAGVGAIPSNGWYIMVHRGTNMESQIDYDPIACGNVSPA